MAGDIEEMFLRVRIRKADRASLRFLWQGPSDDQPTTYETRAMIFGVASSPTTSQFIKNLNADWFQDEFPDAVHGIKKKTYVDDHLDCNDDEEALLRRTFQVKEIHRAG